ncbi:MerR family transcriptional regulator [Microbacterium maritypicum]|uniref:MerR family transcriptional regulator n=1 Tax=Microbacterium maritypicum TaxID=33918 RepID=A0AAJ6AMI9_MICMQ|nr:MerR family transcriptional regulator [Microbacterium liquefaciens]WEF20558.1 MerR family transcriptional regulator [Microbacterium liquefaciens]
MVHRDSRTPLYGIAVAAQLVGLPEATLRLFESKGLLTPARSEGGTRRYSDDDIERLRRAASLREDGVNIAGIARMLDLQDANDHLQVRNEQLREALDAQRGKGRHFAD